jgi:hypothetical protein
MGSTSYFGGGKAQAYDDRFMPVRFAVRMTGLQQYVTPAEMFVEATQKGTSNI